jgi:hypothetical protein
VHLLPPRDKPGGFGDEATLTNRRFDEIVIYFIVFQRLKWAHFCGS